MFSKTNKKKHEGGLDPRRKSPNGLFVYFSLVYPYRQPKMIRDGELLSKIEIASPSARRS